MADLTPHALRVLRARYFLRDAEGRPVEDAAALFRRVARGVAAAELDYGSRKDAEAWAERFEATMAGLDFLPNSPTLMNAGTPLGQLSACFVLPIDDAIDAIFQTLHQTALVHQSGGGTGFNFSAVRPEGDRVARTGGRASGPLSFLRVFDRATEEMRQGGKRRGANMGILDADHPDVEAFVDAKRRPGVLRNFNLSVGATDAFLEAVEADADWALVNPRDRREVRRLPARALFRRIAEAAWAGGDPGMVFLSTINRHNPLPGLGPIRATNPCGEVPLLPYESCNLGSLNLARRVRGGEVDWEGLRGLVHLAVRFLDDVIRVNRYPATPFALMAERNRKIGLGVMGWAEMLIRLGLPYDSEDARRLAGEVAAFVRTEAEAASAALARERGAFPNLPYARDPERPRRHATLLSIAPTGTISIIAGTTPSIEPLFAVAYTREGVLGGEALPEVNPLFVRMMEERGADWRRVVREVAATGTLEGVPGVPEEVRRVFRSALEVSPEDHLKMQAAWQAHVDNAVSKTINLRPEATPEEIERIYLEAWRLGLKGVTVFRYGSKGQQVLELGFHPRGLKKPEPLQTWAEEAGKEG